ncbi:MAG: hypothetical protein QOF53_710 [Nocardioidaceae bacterium]|nr:hypothetical protein [Nocardioidaceae bacterium]
MDALMRASKVIAAAIAHSLAVADSRVTLPQLRVLVVIEDRGPLNLSAVAQALGVNASNASRTCDRLVNSGLLNREEDSQDRRNVVLTLTREGTRVVTSMMTQRRTILEQVVSRMDVEDQRALTDGMDAFVRAAEQTSHDGVLLSDGDGHLLRWLG